MWMAEQLDAAKARGKLNQFFNSADNSSILQMHNVALDQMIADSTVCQLQILLLFYFDPISIVSHCP